MKAYFYLFMAVLLGLVGSVMLKYSYGFSILLPTVIFAVSYIFAFYNFSLALKTLPLFLGYAVWSALSTIGNAILGVLIFNEAFGLMKLWAVVLIVVGIVLVQKEEAN